MDNWSFSVTSEIFLNDERKKQRKEKIAGRVIVKRREMSRTHNINLSNSFGILRNLRKQFRTSFLGTTRKTKEIFLIDNHNHCS